MDRPGQAFSVVPANEGGDRGGRGVQGQAAHPGLHERRAGIHNGPPHDKRPGLDQVSEVTLAPYAGEPVTSRYDPRDGQPVPDHRPEPVAQQSRRPGSRLNASSGSGGPDAGGVRRFGGGLLGKGRPPAAQHDRGRPRGDHCREQCQPPTAESLVQKFVEG